MGPSKSVYRRATDDLTDRHRWSARWAAAAEGAGLTRTVNVAAGETVIVPKLILVGATGATVVLIVKLLAARPSGDADLGAAAGRGVGAGFVSDVPRVCRRSRATPSAASASAAAVARLSESCCGSGVPGPPMGAG